MVDWNSASRAQLPDSHAVEGNHGNGQAVMQYAGWVFLVPLLIFACSPAPATQATSNRAGGSSNNASDISALGNEDLVNLFASDAPQKPFSGFDATSELERRGASAIDTLLEHVDDERISIGMFSMTSSTVGDVCFCTLSCIVAPTPEDYSRSLYRDGADGKLHERPHHLHNTMFNRENVDDWFEERTDRTLNELQIEGLEWWIKAESKIGFPDEHDRSLCLQPLERELKRRTSQSTPE